MLMLYMFRSQRATFGQQIVKKSTVLCNLSIVLLKDVVVVIIINSVVVVCLFFLSYVLQPLCAPFGMPFPWLYLALPEDGLVRPKYVAHKHRMYIYFNDILNVLTNIIVS
jgi:hypothetical protein